MSLQLDQIAPDFEQQSTHGRIRFHDWLGGSWGIFFSHPKEAKAHFPQGWIELKPYLRVVQLQR